MRRAFLILVWALPLAAQYFPPPPAPPAPGFANPMVAPGDMIVGLTGGAPNRLTGNENIVKRFLYEIGDGASNVIAGPDWDLPPDSGGLKFNLTPTPSALTNGSAMVTQDNQMLAAPYSSVTNIDIAHNANADVVLQSWATDPGYPGVTFLPAGNFLFQIKAERLSGNRTVALYGVLREVDAAGASIGTIGTQTEEGARVQFSGQYQFSLYMTITSPYTMASASSRLVLDIHAIFGHQVFGPPDTNTTVRLFVGGAANSLISLPANAPDVTKFVQGPASSFDTHLALFDGTSGHLLKDGSPFTTGVWNATSLATRCSVGTPTTLTANLRYAILGFKTIAFEIEIFDTDNGTCGGTVIATMPFTAKSNVTGACREIALTGKMGMWSWFNSVEIGVLYSDETSVAASNVIVSCSGIAEVE